MRNDSVAFSIGTAAGSALTFAIYEYAGSGPLVFGSTLMGFAMLYGYILVTLVRY